MKVWLVERDDGNACCPGSEIVAVCRTREAAEAAISALYLDAMAKPGFREHYWESPDICEIEVDTLLTRES